MLLLRNMFHLYIVTKCYRLCKHEDDLCFQRNASLHRTPAQSPNTAQEAKTRRAQTSSRPLPPLLLSQPGEKMVSSIDASNVGAMVTRTG